MADSIPVQMFLEQILNLLDETMENVQAMYLDSGTSLFETLATITAEDASKPVSPYCGSLAAQIEHVRFFIDVHERHVRGEKLGKLDWGEVWRTVRDVTPEQWETSKANLMASYKKFVETLKTLPYDNPEQISVAISVAAHTAYHLGEIRQALCILHETPKTGAQRAYGSMGTG